MWNISAIVFSLFCQIDANRTVCLRLFRRHRCTKRFVNHNFRLWVSKCLSHSTILGTYFNMCFSPFLKVLNNPALYLSRSCQFSLRRWLLHEWCIHSQTTPNSSPKRKPKYLFDIPKAFSFQSSRCYFSPIFHRARNSYIMLLQNEKQPPV